MAKDKGGSKRRPKQTEIPGTERPRDEELDAAAEDVAEADAKRSKAQGEANEGRLRLLSLMKAKGVTRYVSEDRKLEIKVNGGKDTVTVRKWTPPPAERDQAGAGA